MKASQMSFLNEDMEWMVEKGMVTFSLGASSIDLRQRIQIEVLKSKRVDQRTRGFYAISNEERID